MSTKIEKFSVGQTYRSNFKVDGSLVGQFVELSGDRNPIHLDDEEAKAYGYPRQVAHGGILVALISKAIGMEIPGPGAVWMSQSVEWPNPVFVGDEIKLVVTVKNISLGAGILYLETIAKNQKGKTVMKGEAKVKVSEKISGSNAKEVNQGRVALVTGASRGIGAAIATCLGTNGLKVAVNYRESQGQAEEIVREIRSRGGVAEAFGADLGDPASTSDMIEEVLRSFGQLDIIVHGASPVVVPVKVGELRYEAVEQFLTPYIEGALTLVSGASPRMIERKFGRLIFLGTSFMFGIPPAGLAPYLTAKEALWGLVKCLATELGPFGITANMVSPSMTVTDFTADIPPRMKELEARKSPARRLATPEDTAALVAFLASDAASYINGVNLPVTGGPI